MTETTQVIDDDAVALDEAVSEAAKQGQQAVGQETTEASKPGEASLSSVIPPEFQGKSLEEVVRIAQHARREMGRQANELGEIRKLADELLKAQLRNVRREEEENPAKDVDFFENPDEAVRRIIENNPRVRAAEEQAKQASMAMAQNRIVQLHPDIGKVVQDPEFAEWVGASKIRTQLFQQANWQYDIDAADELLSTFKQIKAVRQRAATEAETASRKQAMTAAAVDAGGSGESSKKIYRRADLIRLHMTNPAKYAAMASEIEQAYRDGRVR